MLASFFDTDSCKNHPKEISRALRKNLPIWQKIVSFQGFIMVAEICLDGNQGKLVFQFSIFFCENISRNMEIEYLLYFKAYFNVIDLFHTS